MGILFAGCFGGDPELIWFAFRMLDFLARMIPQFWNLQLERIVLLLPMTYAQCQPSHTRVFKRGLRCLESLLSVNIYLLVQPWRTFSY